jgi:hypothetical protein
MRRCAIGVLVVCVVVLASPLNARERDAREPRERDQSFIRRIVRQIVKVFVPTTNSDMLSPPKP